MKIQRILIPIALLGSLAGCANIQKDQQTAVISSGELSQNLQTIDSEAEAIRPHADATGQAHVDSLKSANAAAQTHLPAINKALSENDTLTKQLAKEKVQWWSDRQQALFWWAVGITAGLSILWVVLYFCTGLGTPLAGIASTLFHVLTGGVVALLGKINNNIAAKVNKATSQNKTG